MNILSSAQAQRDYIARETHDIERFTCVRFVPRTSEVDFIEIINGGGCWSWLGRVGGRQELSMQSPGCFWEGTMIHEWYHALGYDHMHNHIDRDRYVNIHWENIQAGMESQFHTVDPQWFYNFGTSYDLLSIMHYPRWAFSSNGRDTITPREPGFLDIIGETGVQSSGDIARINNMYEC
jgi:hypothetical protein